ncbi:MAG: peptidase S9 [Gemmatimonadetes bacterium]|nr:MAG: peptidase S9 [Gemmatimonadota bacterium]
MVSHRARWAIRASSLLVALLAIVASLPSRASAQYFGRNKVQYEKFNWKILRSDHFDNFFYPPESLIVHDYARMAERWYTRHSDTFRHAFDRKSLIFYADHADFEQTNVVNEDLAEGIEGVTEGLRTRVIMPFNGIYADNDHVLGHELVHVFQYNIAEGAPGGGLARLNALPGWLIEGMAEYFSLGRNDPLTAMWMRDAVMRNKFPTVKQLTTDPRFFPYRYGQALWAYVGGKWGDRAIIDVYRAALRVGWDAALVRVLGINNDSLSKEWAAANRAMYLPQIAGRVKPDSEGKTIIALGKKMSEQQNVSPSVSPDGNYLAFVTQRNLFTTDVYIADAHTGRLIKKLGGPESDPHFDAISFINSSGGWSPDASKFAFIVYASGNNEIAILNTRNSSVERRIKLPGIGALSHVSWSPDGRTLAISGQHGGIGDLFLLDLQTEQIRQLTNDRNAEIQPAWSPDGRTIAFATDRGPETDFNTMVFSPLQIATIDVASGAIRVYSPFPHAKHNINPQWTPDGRELYFVSDPDGIPNIFRLNLGTNDVRRVTNVATGVSGITSISPTLTVSQKTGRVLFTVFQAQGFTIRALEPDQAIGEPAVLTDGGQLLTASALPPGDVTRSMVLTYLADPIDGLASGNDFKVTPYHASFSLDALGQPSVGVVAGGPFGTGVAGGVSAFFGDQLSDQMIATAIQANGTVRDIGGAVYYTNLRNRWNYGAGLEHVPYLTGGIFYGVDTINGNLFPTINQVLERIYIDQASVFSQYPFDQTRRVEFNVSATRLGFQAEVDKLIVDQSFSQVLAEQRQSLPAPPAIYYAQPEIAFVGDNSFAAYTSPVAGQRYRLSYSPTVGNISFQTALADYRRYFFIRPTTLAFRALHYGRYGKDSESNRISPLYLGEETLIRGYGFGSINNDECLNGQTQQSSCPVFDRMLGSRLGVVNLELRIPVIGSTEFGLLNFPFLPTEIAPFFDGGVAYTSNQAPDFRFSTSAADANSRVSKNCQNQTPTNQNNFIISCTDRIPVFSTGLSARINFLGYMIFEAYFAHPFQRPGKSWVWGFQLAPGW